MGKKNERKLFEKKKNWLAQLRLLDDYGRAELATPRSREVLTRAGGGARLAPRRVDQNSRLIGLIPANYNGLTTVSGLT